MIGSDALRRDRAESATVIVLVAAASAAGALIAITPVIGLGLVSAVVVLVALLTRPSRIPRIFIGVLGIVCTAYALGDRGLAYVGFGQVYIGEITLLLGLLATLIALPAMRVGLLHVLLFAFLALGAVRTIPYIGQYGVFALRDGVVWGYALFAVAVAATFRAEWFPILVRAYRRVVPIMLVWFPIAIVADAAVGRLIPHWPGAPVPIIYMKEGDAAVHVAGIGAFILVGLYASGPRLLRDGFVWTLWLANLAFVGAVSRGGLLAALLGSAASVLFVRSSTRIVQGAAIALAFFVALYLINPSTETGYAGRPVSFTQLVANVTSVVGDSDDQNLDGTRAWRLAWWDEIIGYTVEGPYRWTGKGFGVNLADADGFQVNADGSLRSPHNAHLTMLARGGVPMFTLWVLIQVAFGLGLVRAGLRASRSRHALLPVIAVLFAYWLAALINMSFDVYLEGPQGGIIFWSVIGLGMVAMRATREPAPGAARTATTMARATPTGSAGA